MPDVSILMSVYNGGELLHHAIASIQAQTMINWELVAVNDGSTDGSGDELEKFAKADSRIRIIHQENQGLGPALHRAAKAATGMFLARMDADDISAPTRLARLLGYFSCRPKHVLAGTWAWQFMPPYGIYGAKTAPDDDSELRRRLDSGINPFTHGSVMFRRDSYVRTQGYRLSAGGEDYDAWLQMAERGSLGILKSFEYLYRQNADGITFSSGSRTAHLGRLSLTLARERRANGEERTDWRSECQRIRSNFSARSQSKREQMRNYTLALVHLSSGYRGRAALYLWKSFGPNVEGLRALSRLIVSVVLGLRMPDFEMVLRSKEGSRNLLIQENISWTRPWLQAMGLPFDPYCKGWRNEFI